VTPTGTGAGSPATSPLPLLRTGGWRPGAVAARVLGSLAVAVAAVPSIQDLVMGRARPAVVGIAYIQTGHAFLLQAIFTIWPGLVPIQTGAPA
jgi:hypothetical protein